VSIPDRSLEEALNDEDYCRIETNLSGRDYTDDEFKLALAVICFPSFS
jgi:hypothetical protein